MAYKIKTPFEILSQVQGGSRSAPLFNPEPTKAPAITAPSPDEVLAQSKSPDSPSFFSNLKTMAGGLLKKAGSAVGGFVKQQAENVKDFATGDLKVGIDDLPKPKDYLEGIKQTGQLVNFLAQGINEGVARIIKSTAIGAFGEEGTRKIAEFGGPISIGEFSKTATGKDDILSYQSIFQKANDFALNQNATIKEAQTFAGLTVIGSLFLDNPAIGPGKGAAFKLSKESVERLAKETSEDAIKAIIKLENPAIRDIELDALAPVFRDAKDALEVQTAADQVARIQQAQLRKTATQDTPAPDDVLVRSQENLRAPEVPTAAVEEPLGPSYFRASEDAAQGTRFLPVEGQPVKIIEGLDTFVHQPENGAFEVLESSTGRMIGRAAETPEAAIKSAQEALQGKRLEDIMNRLETYRKTTQAGGPVATRGAMTEKPALGAPRPFRNELIRDISKETDPGTVLQRIKVEFPVLSDQALAPIAKRLAQLKRTGDIEGILQVVRNISEDVKLARVKTGTQGISKESLARSATKVGKAEAVGDLPPSIGQLMTESERNAYIDNISRVVKNKEDAVLAQQEYEALFEYADQRILDRYEELSIQRNIIEDAIENHPGKQVSQLYKGSFLSPRDVPLDELLTRRPSKRVDSKLDEIMGAQGQAGTADTLVQGQKALDGWNALRAQLNDVKAELKELGPQAKATRVLQTMVDDVPVIARKEAGEIEALATPEAVRSYKDISGFMGQGRDVYRNFEKVFGDRFAEVKKAILDPFDKSKGAMVDTLNEIGDDLEKNVIKKLGINKGSKESAAVQLYGEGKLSAGDVATQFGAKRAQDIFDADRFFRSRYDDLIDKVNKVRADIFPNDPTKLVPKRKDYYRHFQEMGDGFRALINLFESPAGINPQLAGLSEWTKPKAKFLSFAQERLGKDSDIDAVGGFLNYAPSYAHAVHIDPHIGKFRYLRRRLSESAPTPGVREPVEINAPAGKANAFGETDMVPTGTELKKQEGINNFLTFLDDYANDLAGKTNPFDRFIQKVVPGGRKTFRVIDWINSRVKANAILGNVSSSISQIFNVPQGVASAKLYTLPGIRRTLASIVAPNEPMAASSFIKERFKDDLSARFKVDWVDHPLRGTSERGKELAVWMTQVLDEVGSKFIWNAHYSKALAEGIEDPIKYADDITRKLVGGRGVGEVPLLQKSKVFQLVAPFQLEVGNAWHVLGEFMSKKDFGAVATLFIANYLMNRAAEEVRGSPVVFDPINSLMEGVSQAADEMQEGDASRAAYKFLGRQAGEILSNVPLGQTVAAALPEDFVKNKLDFAGGKKELFGSGDPGRFGGGLLVVKSVFDPLYKLFPPFGGAQAKKTIEGIQSMLAGEVRDGADRLSFKTDRTIKNVAQAVLFGKNGTSEANEFYDERDDLFTRIYRQDATRTEKRIEAEKVWADIKDMKKGEAAAKLKDLDTTDPAMSSAIKDIAKAEALGLDGAERLIKMLGVENGERAKYISRHLDDLKTVQEQAAWLKNLQQKRLLTEDVSEQLKFFLAKKAGKKSEE